MIVKFRNVQIHEQTCIGITNAYLQALRTLPAAFRDPGLNTTSSLLKIQLFARRWLASSNRRRKKNGGSPSRAAFGFGVEATPSTSYAMGSLDKELL